MVSKLTKFIKNMHRGPYSDFPEDVQKSIRRTFIALAIIGLVTLGIMALFF